MESPPQANRLFPAAPSIGAMTLYDHKSKATLLIECNDYCADSTPPSSSQRMRNFGASGTRAWKLASS
jgi:hypothetical protein